MLEFLLSTPPVIASIGNITQFRLVALSGARGGVGVWEFELYDSLNRNLCRTAGLIPTATASANASGVGTPITPDTMASYPPNKSIDGGTGIWTDTCYINTMADGSSYLEYIFPTPVSPKWWRMMPEGTWLPSPDGMKLLALIDGVWKELVGVSDAQGWVTKTWRKFDNLQPV